jgi:hypothetical protein
VNGSFLKTLCFSLKLPAHETDRAGIALAYNGIDRALTIWRSTVNAKLGVIVYMWCGSDSASTNWATPPCMAGAGFEPALAVFALRLNFNLSLYSTHKCKANAWQKQGLYQHFYLYQSRLSKKIAKNLRTHFLLCHIRIVGRLARELDRLLQFFDTTQKLIDALGG